MMIRAIFACILTCLVTQAQQLKVATVRMGELFNKYPSSIAFVKTLEEERKKIEADPRIAIITKGEQELKELSDKLQAKARDLQKISGGDQAAQLKQLETETLQGQQKEAELKSIRQDLSEYLQEQGKQMTKIKNEKMQQFINEISELIKKTAISGGYDVVYEVSGFTNSGLPLIVYQKEGISTDITDEILKLFPPAPAEKAPEPVQVKPNIPAPKEGE